MRVRLGVVFAGAFFLWGCSKPPLPSTEQALVSLAYQSVLEDLRDPASVEFSELVWIDGPQATSVCGKYNAANGYGGMAGPRAFVRRFLPEEIAFARNAVAKDGFDYAVPYQRAKAALAIHAFDQSKFRPTQAPVFYRDGDSNDLAYLDNAAIAAGCYDGKPVTAELKALPLPKD